MSPILWLQKIFVPNTDTEEEETENAIIEKPSFFEWNQHMRILLAILVVFISAFALWWIVA